MKPAVVVDVGNSFIKWGRCQNGAVTDKVSLPDDPQSWQRQLQSWKLTEPCTWVVTGVHPPRCEQLMSWLRQQGHEVLQIDSEKLLSLRVPLERPDWVGIDRLLNAVAANSKRRPQTAAAIVGAGTAVTVDWLDETGAFRGGAIIPGLHMMAQALHEHTALLPLVSVEKSEPMVPGTSTIAAMEAGIFWSVAGGVWTVIQEMARTSPLHDRQESAEKQFLTIFLTGGGAPLLQSAMTRFAQESRSAHVSEFSLSIIPWPLMTLEGIRLAAEALP